MGLCYANPPFCQRARVLTKIAIEGARVVLCTPEWGSTRVHAYWRCLRDSKPVRRTDLRVSPMYVLEDSGETMHAHG